MLQEFLKLQLCVVMLLSFCGCSGDKNADTKAKATSKRELPKPDVSDFHVDWSVEDQVETSVSPLQVDVRLTEVQEQLGLKHRYENGDQGKAYLVETIGAGCGWLDFDLDGRPDLYLNQAGHSTKSDRSNEPSDELFHNLGDRFEKVSDAAKIDERFYSQGVAVGDFDNDGFDDVYVTNVGENTLWMNCGDGTFIEMASFAGVADPRWSTSVAWGDIDLDGDLDLYVCNYCVYDPADPKVCKNRYGQNKICNPSEMEAWPDACFINKGDGTFTDQAVELGLTGDGNRALGVAIADFTNDGWPDIYVANDTTENFLFVNEKGQSFIDEAGLMGCAVDRAGGPQGSMGLAVADYDRNGFLDLYCTHYYEESNTLYANLGEQGFVDQTAAEGLHRPTLNFLGFGTVFADLNSDTREELMVLNGHVDHSKQASDPRMNPQLFTRLETGRWLDISGQAGKFFDQKRMGRGLATCDFDLDGDVDLACVPENDEFALLENASSAENNWVRFRFHGVTSNRKGIGCRVRIQCGEYSAVQELCGGTSFAVSHEPVLHFGLGNASAELTAEVEWPSGARSKLKPQINSLVEVIEPNS